MRGKTKIWYEFFKLPKLVITPLEEKIVRNDIQKQYAEQGNAKQMVLAQSRHDVLDEVSQVKRQAIKAIIDFVQD